MKRIIEILQKNNFSFELIKTDEEIKSLKERSNYFKVDIFQTASNLIIHTDIGFFSLIVSGGRNQVNFKEIKDILKCNSARLATQEEVMTLTGFCIGSVPLLGIDLPYIIDKKLLNYSFIYGDSSEKNTTLKVDPSALIKLNNTICVLQ